MLTPLLRQVRAHTTSLATKNIVVSFLPSLFLSEILECKNTLDWYAVIRPYKHSASNTQSFGLRGIRPFGLNAYSTIQLHRCLAIRPQSTGDKIKPLNQEEYKVREVNPSRQPESSEDENREVNPSRQLGSSKNENQEINPSRQLGSSDDEDREVNPSRQLGSSHDEDRDVNPSRQPGSSDGKDREVFDHSTSTNILPLGLTSIQSFATTAWPFGLNSRTINSDLRGIMYDIWAGSSGSRNEPIGQGKHHGYIGP
ncbi:hypothetical protein LR48_Vigan11g071300 [Vigna angularis]|uniref:Uncharacterized protein n=1 Tax=Phaseolus angularis TaxID=3914 RepID=A0A0L9VRH8_PHAAN|nr:hypothetical protein LR48_Vigan11g071300 [Vigna angularis]